MTLGSALPRSNQQRAASHGALDPNKQGPLHFRSGDARGSNPRGAGEPARATGPLSLPRAFRNPALTRSAIRLRSSSATATRTVKTIRPVGIVVSTCSLRLTNAMPSALKVRVPAANAKPSERSGQTSTRLQHRIGDDEAVGCVD